MFNCFLPAASHPTIFSQTGAVANSKAPVSVASCSWHHFLNSSSQWEDVNINVFMSYEGERRPAEEESGKIWHERFIRFTKGDYELQFMLLLHS